MATTVDGVIVGGSAGNSTWGRNRSGAYKRNRTKPVNPNSVRQQSVRQNFRAAVNVWMDPGETVDRAGWNEYAAAVPWLNRAGETIRLTGQNMFVRSYAFALENGLANPEIFYASPPQPNIGDISITAVSLIYDVSSTDWGLTFTANAIANDWNTDNANSCVQISVSEVANLGRSFRPNRFRQMLTILGSTTAGSSAPIVTRPVTPPFSLSVAGGQIMWFKFRGLDGDTGRLSESQLIGPITTSFQA